MAILLSVLLHVLRRPLTPPALGGSQTGRLKAYASNTNLRWRGPIARERRPWTRQEDDLLTKFYSNGEALQTIVEKLDGRSYRSVSMRVYHVLSKAGKVRLRTVHVPFTPGEDDLLRKLDAKGLSEKEIQPYFPSRSGNSIKGKLNALRIGSISLDFSPAEDALLIKLREKDRLAWSGVALQLPGRKAKSCSIRYCSITPASARTNVHCSPHAYSTEEVEEVRRLRILGLSWKAIVKRIPRFSVNSATDLMSRAKVQGRRPAVSLGTTARRMWNKEEDAKLHELKASGRTFNEIDAALPGRTPQGARARWWYLCKEARLKQDIRS